jgi:hypothetical protein
MQRETNSPMTLGQAIDQIIEALTGLDQQGQMTAVQAACDHLKIQAPARPAAQTRTPATSTAEISEAGQQRGAADVRALKQEKQPSSANEMAALVAFYLSEIAPGQERKTDVEVSDMERYFKQAGFPLPRKPVVLLVNAKNAGYFDMVGSGKYRLNAVGYNLVAHNLPRGQSTVLPARRSLKSRKGTRRKKSRSASARG